MLQITKIKALSRTTPLNKNENTCCVHSRCEPPSFLLFILLYLIRRKGLWVRLLAIQNGCWRVPAVRVSRIKMHFLVKWTMEDAYLDS
ncbi:hypothetical protein TNIN_457881 [Trichonephila inaurata madagascariensis]|uniref:Uncharacterized protein n=1 Tax=Trichonephila inaurata madagascariensis TaxID=2747483 RepID=A0A8X6YDC1_9ARAC|nr:hypothetical protein TNIN_457881 [Trichonephila inaurata madagascariensis]